MESQGVWKQAETDWDDSQAKTAWSVWSRDFVNKVSHSPQVLGVWALGSVLAISLRDEEVGYKSNAAKKLQAHLRQGTGEWNAHSRVLGNEKPLESKTREASIAEFIDRTKHIQDEHPEVDFTKSVIEPTMNLTYDIKENVEEETRKKHESLITLMLQNTGDLAKAEKYLMEARDCLKGYPDILKQFDDIYINKRPVSVMLGQLHECMTLKNAQ
ncbi:hypothetical protein Neosp_008960 [[Neocosmospora] mangrovei]